MRKASFQRINLSGWSQSLRYQVNDSNDDCKTQCRNLCPVAIPSLSGQWFQQKRERLIKNLLMGRNPFVIRSMIPTVDCEIVDCPIRKVAIPSLSGQWFQHAKSYWVSYICIVAIPSLSGQWFQQLKIKWQKIALDKSQSLRYQVNDSNLLYQKEEKMGNEVAIPSLSGQWFQRKKEEGVAEGPGVAIPSLSGQWFQQRSVIVAADVPDCRNPFVIRSMIPTYNPIGWNQLGFIVAIPSLSGQWFQLWKHLWHDVNHI